MTSSFEPSSVTASQGGGFVPDPLPCPAGGFRGAGPQRSDVAGAEATGAAVPVEQQLREAFERGRAEGREELPWREAEALERAAEGLEEAARALAGLRRGYLLSHRLALIDLAAALAERIVGRAVETDPDVLAGLVERVLAEIGEERPVVLRLSRQDHETLQQGLAPRLARLAEEHGVTLEPEAGLAPGDVRLRAGNAEVDARLSELLRRLREELAEAAHVEEDDA